MKIQRICPTKFKDPFNSIHGPLGSSFDPIKNPSKNKMGIVWGEKVGGARSSQEEYSGGNTHGLNWLPPWSQCLVLEIHSCSLSHWAVLPGPSSGVIHCFEFFYFLNFKSCSWMDRVLAVNTGENYLKNYISLYRKKLIVNVQSM